ncbi:translational activator of cytochrome c oxidase 1-like isoform X2 [Periplaneta americana]
MPQVSIQNALKQAQVPKTNAKAGQYEIRGPGGCTIIVCTLTDNPARVRATLNTIVRKANSSFVDGAIGGLFHHKGVIKASPPENTSLETAVDHAIEVGAEDVAEVDSLEDRVLQFLCEASLLHRVRGKLEKLQYSIKTAECEFIALHHVALSDADLEAVGKLYNKLEEDPDVVQLFDNIV